MSAANDEFLSLNSTRAYPLDDAATTLDDTGRYLPAGILADASVTFPQAIGDYVYLSAVSVSPNGVSLVFAASVNPAVAGITSTDFLPVASLSVPAPVQAGVQYPLTPLYPGAAGWVIFGPDAAGDLTYQGRFSTVMQSQLLIRCGCSWPVPLPSLSPSMVTSLAQQIGVPLQGLVTLQAGSDITLMPTDIVIDGTTYEAIGIALDDQSSDPTSTYNVYTKYSGPCSARPQERTCVVPAIETINGITPDCNGRIEIEFRHCYVAVDHCGYGGVTLDLPLGLSDLCPAPTRSLNLGSESSCQSSLAPDEEPEAWSASLGL